MCNLMQVHRCKVAVGLYLLLLLLLLLLLFIIIIIIIIIIKKNFIHRLKKIDFLQIQEYEY